MSYFDCILWFFILHELLIVENISRIPVEILEEFPCHLHNQIGEVDKHQLKKITF